MVYFRLLLIGPFDRNNDPPATIAFAAPQPILQVEHGQVRRSRSPRCKPLDGISSLLPQMHSTSPGQGLPIRSITTG